MRTQIDAAMLIPAFMLGISVGMMIVWTLYMVSR